jgi:hypothetical protein
MGFIFAVIPVVFLIYLLLRIAGMVGGTTTVTTKHIANGPGQPKPLEDLTKQQVEEKLASMPTEWITYMGSTPPLELKVRGVTEDLYRRFTKAKADAFGRDTLERMSRQEQMALVMNWTPEIMARAYVIDWRGAVYPNGNPMPFDPAQLAVMTKRDEFLGNFIAQTTDRLCASVGWTSE